MSNEMSVKQGNEEAINSDEKDLVIKEIVLILPESEYKKIEAGAFYNNYESLEEYVKDLTIEQIETDKQRYLKSKESYKLKK